MKMNDIKNIGALENKFIYLNPNSKIISRHSGIKLINSKDGIAPITINSVILLLLSYLDGNTPFKDVIKNISNILNTDEDKSEERVLSLICKIGEHICISENEKYLYYDNRSDVRKNLQKTRALKLTKRQIPEIITFKLTDICSRKCIYCFSDAKFCVEHDKSNKFLSLTRFKEVLEESRDIGIRYVELGGGDPFKNKLVLKYLDILSHSGIEEYIVSTKEHININLAREIYGTGIKKLQVSLDTDNEVQADLLMGVPGSFREIVSSIENLVISNVEVTVNSVITSMSPLSLYKFVNFLSNMGVKTISFSMYGISCGRVSERLFPTSKQLNGYAEEIKFIKKINGINLKYPNLNIHEWELSRSDNKEIRHIYRNFCGALVRRFTVNHLGQAIYCDYMPNIIENVLGDLHTENIMDVWNSSTAVNKFLPKKEYYQNSICFECYDFDKCWPKRCHMRTYLEHGTIYNYDPDCKYAK